MLTVLRTAVSSLLHRRNYAPPLKTNRQPRSTLEHPAPETPRPGILAGMQKTISALQTQAKSFAARYFHCTQAIAECRL
jgi:hypothetical protein